MSNFSITKDSIGTRLNNNDIVQSNEVRTNCVYFSDGTAQYSSSGGNLPVGTNYGDYLYWNNNTNLWTVGNTDINLGAFSGQNNQGTNAVALGYKSGQNTQGYNAISIGNQAGQITQGYSAVAIGVNAGQNTQGSGAVAIGDRAGQNTQSYLGIAIGVQAGQYSQSVGAISIGYTSGNTNQGQWGIAIGDSAGENNQQNFAVAVGFNAGANTQGNSAIAIGNNAGLNTQGSGAIAFGVNAGNVNQSQNAIALGNNAGSNGQLNQSVAIGYNAGRISQGQNCIAIGPNAGQTSQSNNSIVMNANSTWTGDSSYQTLQGFFANPIRSVNTGVGANVLAYNTTSKELYLNTGKTFVIDHPEDNNKYLVHACIEGPENSVFYRGRGKIENNEFTVIELPSYVKRFTHNYNVQVTKIYKKGDTTPIYASDIEDGKFKVYSQVNCEFNWLVIGERSDCKELEVEPNKCDVDVKGNGPYKYL